jgi:superfamily II DNA or RNA helicase
MANIIVRDKLCKIDEETDLTFLSQLDNHLSFKYVGVEFMPAYKNHYWDGVERLINKRLEFMTGLLPRVIDFYHNAGKEINVIDQRKPFVPGVEIDLSTKLKELNIIPFNYQINAVNEAIQNDRMLFKHATGSGKSLTTALITAKFGLPTIVWVIGIDLLYQFHALFSKLFDQKIGMVGDGVCDVQPISIVSIWTAGKALGLKKQDMEMEDIQDEEYKPTDREQILKLVKEASIHHFDEAHVCSAKTIRTIYKNSNPTRIYGWSGSPERDDGSNLMIEGIFGRKIDEVKASQLIKIGILAKPYIKFFYVKGQSHYKDTYNKVYSDNIINNEYRNNLIVNETQKLLNKGYQILVLFKNLSHGKILKKKFAEKNIEIGYLTGRDKSEDRNQVKEDFISGKLNCVLASTVFDIGLNCPNITGIVLAGAGKSSVRCKQRLGRALRGGKEKYNGVACIEFFDDCRYLKKHALIRKSIYETEEEFVIIMPKEYKLK